MNEKRLGKIEHVEFGHGGYQDAQLGLTLTLSGKGWGVGTGIYGGWSQTIKWSKNCRWTEEKRSADYAEMAREIDRLLIKAKVRSVDKLKGIPIEAEFDGMVLKDWRVLEDVL